MKSRSDVSHSVWVPLLSVCGTLVRIFQGVHISVCVCEFACSYVLLCKYVNHTHPVCWATRLGTGALLLTPCLFLSLTLALCRNPLRWRVRKSHPQTPPELCHRALKTTKETFPSGSPKAGRLCHTYLCTETHHSLPAPRCMKQGHGLLWWTETLSFQQIRPQKVKACVPGWRTVIIQTSGKCASPHERREQNGIKLDQGRVYFSKRKQDRGLKYRLQR